MSQLLRTLAHIASQAKYPILFTQLTNEQCSYIPPIHDSPVSVSGLSLQPLTRISECSYMFQVGRDWDLIQHIIPFFPREWVSHTEIEFICGDKNVITELPVLFDPIVIDQFIDYKVYITIHLRHAEEFSKLPFLHKVYVRGAILNTTDRANLFSMLWKKDSDEIQAIKDTFRL